MKRFGLIAIVATLIILAGGVYLFSRGSTSPAVAPVSGYEYFWGNGCPNCETVEKFFETWEGRDKVAIEKKEVWYNKTNAGLMAARGQTCGIPRSELGVPFLVTPEEKCLIGSVDIINLFTEMEFDEKNN